MGLGFGCGKFTHWDPLFIGLSIVACLVARLFVTFPLSALANLRRPEGKKIGLSMQVMMTPPPDTSSSSAEALYSVCSYSPDERSSSPSLP